ncbi:MAG: hypothetical protein GY862_28915 [Gammaproteobacteria bacterium]|nr:hypothetical protein [Gammaproteobacteria bacterium]
MKRIVLFAVGFILSFNAVQAEEEEANFCVVYYTRTACKGQEAISYKKCGGQQSCKRYKLLDSLEACQKEALNGCNNKRLHITKSKVIMAEYKGKVIKSKTGKEDFCLDYENRDKEYNQCPEDKK